MSKYYIGNAFALSMIDKDLLERAGVLGLNIGRMSDEGMRAVADSCESCVGHVDTAAVFSSMLGCTIPANRVSITLSEGDQLFVGQYVGPRLSEGTTRLPEGARIDWYRVVIPAGQIDGCDLSD